MRVLISPAKKMRTDTDSLPPLSLPEFLAESETLLSALRCLTAKQLQTLWKCNDTIAALNIERLAQMDLQRNLTPAILSYDGIQYQYMAPGVLERSGLDYIQTHLRILSGFYGLLRPFDGVVPYRLEMGARLAVGTCQDLYAFWGGKLAAALTQETDLVVDLASKEYSRAVMPHLPAQVRQIKCTFGQLHQGKVVEKGTLCKMARGEMVRFLAENQIEDARWIPDFTGLGYRYCPERSSAGNYVFLQEETHHDA